MQFPEGRIFWRSGAVSVADVIQRGSAAVESFKTAHLATKVGCEVGRDRVTTRTERKPEALSSGGGGRWSLSTAECFLIGGCLFLQVPSCLHRCGLVSFSAGGGDQPGVKGQSLGVC